MNTLLLLLLSSLPSQGAQNPPGPCDGMPCTPRLLEIAEGFERAEGIKQSELPLLASGDCHHMAEAYRPTDTHHGMVLLDTKDETVFMGGRFSFFAPENPYQDWDLERARKESENMFQPHHRVELTPSFAFSDMNPGQTPIWLYWLRRSNEKIFVMGHWGVFHRFLCEMKAHK